MEYSAGHQFKLSVESGTRGVALRVSELRLAYEASRAPRSFADLGVRYHGPEATTVAGVRLRSFGEGMMSNWPGEDAVFAVAEPFIEQWEGYRDRPYRDSAGIPTIGFGTIRYPNRKSVTMNDGPITRVYAIECLQSEMHEKCDSIIPDLTRKPTVNQAAAMVSLAYNIGSAAFASSTVLREFNAGNIPAAANGFLLWDKAHVDGKLVVVPGLENRRTAERALFLR